MKRLSFLIVVAAAIMLISGCSQAGRSAADPDVQKMIDRYPDLAGKPYTIEQVERIIDGDTFATAEGHKVRLIGVNTPEVKGESKELGLKASAYAANLLKGKQVVLFPDTGDTDKYGRLLRYVFIEQETTMFNERLLTDGYASVMTIQPNVTYADYFVALERQARAAGTGLWGNPDESEPEEKATAADKESKEGTKSAPTCQDPQIKGNIRGSSKIYHMPGGQSYEQTKAEQMFCTEDEAAAAGFRKAAR
ncbi:thermonuclease family protein [Paenibacillus spongiae]|uniref:Thermonuclease family protein n=1 Tax=Paenibacillus spongiae TaxID=2909671 RepID=A0ABY5S6A8_9BACL|nr:thermonuclease family protein [Paenibacillus spongiae]UVI27853.1 thermonuclease family protein [Paenibacillus spongiae]